MKTAQDIYTITIKQIVRLQERMHFEKIQLVQVQNGRQSAIIHFHMAVFLTSLYQIQSDRKSAISYLDWPDIG